MNLIVLGLCMLANLTGFSSGASFESADESLQYVLSKADFYEVGSNNIVQYGDVYNTSGENRYLEIEFENGKWVLFDKQNYEEIEQRSISPYSQGDPETLKLYDEDKVGFDYAYYEQDIDDFVSEAGLLSSSLMFGDYYESQGKDAGNYYKNIALTPNAHVIDNYYYFEKLGDKHAWNSKGTCAIVASEILLGYYDTFSSDLFVDESYDVISHEYISKSNYSTKDFSQSPGVDDCSVDDHDFHDYLVDIAKNEVGEDPEVDGMTTLNQIKLINNYLDKRGIKRSMNTSEGNLGDIWTQRAIGIIKNGIDSGRPVISNGSGHSTVAYAYDDNYVWVHTGWGWTGATPWSTYESGLFSNYSAGCIDIIYEGNHVHSDNYFAYNKNEYLCPCSKKHTSTDLLPEDYGFDQRYNANEEFLEIHMDNLEISTTRLRTGYIEEEYINLSPKRKNAGEAYLEYRFSKKIRMFSINLSYWQIKDKLSGLNSTAILEAFNDDGYVFKKDLLQANLSTDRKHQDYFEFSFIGKEITGFRISMTAPAIGDRNLGRISIGDITFIHEL